MTSYYHSCVPPHTVRYGQNFEIGRLVRRPLFLFDLIDIGQNLRDSEIKAFRHFALKRSAVVNGPRQRRRGNDRHVVGMSGGADLEGDEIGALRHLGGRTHSILIIFERDGVVTGIGDHHVGLLYVVHHASARQLALNGANTTTHLEIALGLLALLAHFLEGQIQLAGEIPDLKEGIGHYDHDQRRARNQQSPHQQAAGLDDAVIDGLLANADDVVIIEPQPDADRRTYQHELQYRLEQLEGAAPRKQLADAFDRIEFVPLESNRLQAENPAAHRRRHQQRNDEQQHQQRRKAPQARIHRVEKCRRQQIWIAPWAIGKLKILGHDLHDGGDDVAAEKQQAAAARRHHQ